VPVRGIRERRAQLLEEHAVRGVPESRAVTARRGVGDDTEEDRAAGHICARRSQAGVVRCPSSGRALSRGDVVDHVDCVRAAATPDADVGALVAQQAEPRAVTVEHPAKRHLDGCSRYRPKLAVRERVASRVPVVRELNDKIFSIRSRSSGSVILPMPCGA
jgi:hypothetical protein